MKCSAGLIDELNIRDLGGLGDNQKITAHFPHYRVEEYSDGIELCPDFNEGDIPDIQFGYGKSGQKILVSLCNLYLSTKDADSLSAADSIADWCSANVHPYYFYGEPFAQYDWAKKDDSEYWDSMVNLLSSYDFRLQRFQDDLEKLYNDTQVLTNLYRYMSSDDSEFTLSQIHDPKTRKIFAKWHPSGKGTEQNEMIAAYLKTLPQFPLSLVLGDDLSFKLVPDIKSVFDVAYYALAKFVSFPTDLPIGYGDKTGMAFCEACGNIFIRHGNRQKYCDNPECKKIRNRKKSKDYFLRAKGCK